jgi:hypothetical protein
MKNPRSNKSVFEIVGETILSAIAVTSVSIIYLRVLSTPGPKDTPNFTINGKIEAGGERAC